VCGGDGHTEAIRIEYDPSEVTYDELLNQFMSGHQPSPSQVQYKSAVWYHNEEQREAVEKTLGTVPQGSFVDIDTATDWHDAEEYHQKYYKKGCSVM